jgi:hypothetical protein
MAQLVDLLELDVTDGAVERWEKNLAKPTPEHRKRLVEFLGFDPEAPGLTGDS